MANGDESQEIRPLGALTHPMWLVALGLLVLNDHVLKHSELAGAFTGKLSDFAGMIVAPVLLAAILRVRTERGLWICAAAVGTVFAAINLSPELAATWDAAVSGIALPYHTTPDPTDLMALAALPVGVWLLQPACTLDGRHTRRRLGYAAAIVGAAACVATSPPPPGTPDIRAQVSVLNKSHELHVLRIRMLDRTTRFDCDAVTEAPGEYFKEEDFGTPTRWELMSGQEIGIGTEGNWYDESAVFGGRSCTAALIQSDTVDDILVFWTPDLEVKSFAFDPDIPKEIPADNQTIVLDADYSNTPDSEMHPYRYRPCEEDDMCGDAGIREAARIPTGAQYDWRTVNEGGDRLHYEVNWRPFDSPTQIPEFCRMPGPGMGLEWGERPGGTWKIYDIQEGIDGCHTLSMSGLNGDEPTREWIVCAPYEALTTLGTSTNEAAQLELELSDTTGSGHIGIQLVFKRYVPGQGVTEETSVYMTRGTTLPTFLGLDLSSELRNGCGPVDAGCHREIPVDTTVSRGGGESRQLQPGDVTQFDGGSRIFYLMRAVNVPMLQGRCEDGSDSRVGTALNQNPGNYYESVTVVSFD